MKETMMAPKIRTMSEERAFDRITSSMWGKLLQAPEKGAVGRLKHLLEYADRSRPTRFLSAELIAVGASPHSHVLRIARGSEDGVLQGAAVVAPEGAVGQVAVTTAHYADVQLIVSPTS